MVDFTVAIRVYNGAERLELLIERLRSQINTDSIQWEILVVDNNSTDATAELMRRHQTQWRQPFALRYVNEKRQGAVYARQRAVAEARGTWIGFLDDDNLPATNWVAAAWQFAQAHPEAGAFSGRVHGEFETPPPPQFKRIASYLAITDRGNHVFSYNDRRDRVLPPGAGLVISRQVWLQTVPEQIFLSGPIGDAIGLKGEDLEILSYIQQAGWQILHAPTLEIVHRVPAWRLERDYLLSLVRSIGLSQHHIRMRRRSLWQRPLFLVLYAINDSRKLLWHYWTYRSTFNSDVVAACELYRLIYSLLSPFYIGYCYMFAAEQKAEPYSDYSTPLPTAVPRAKEL